MSINKISQKLCNTGLTLVIVLIIAACSWVYPDYHKPSFKINKSWSTSNLKLNESDLANNPWWQQFDDDELNSFITEAIKNNNNVKQALANIDSAKGQLKAIQLSFIPTLGTYAGYSTNPSLGIPGGFFGIWPGYFSFNIFATLQKEKAAKINLQAQKYVLQSTRLVLIANVTNSYMAMIAETEESILLNKLAIDLANKSRIENLSFKNGLSSRYDYENTLAELKKVKASELIVKSNILKSRNALSYLLNQVPHKLNVKTKFNNIQIRYTAPGLLPATVLDNRPDLHFAEEKYKLAVQNTGAPYTSLLPSITLNQFVGGWNSFTSSNPTGNNAAITDSYLATTLNPSIFGQIDQLKGEKKSALYNYLDTINKVLKDVDNSLIDFNYMGNNYKAIKERYNFSLNKYNLQDSLYKKGIISKLHLLDEQILLDRVNIELNQAKLIHTYSLIRVYQELGGGYKVK
jgi:outer membrane protein, multidrug efflux system